VDTARATFLIVFGAAAIAFGLWVRPKWKRAKLERQARKDGLLLTRAREWRLGLETITSIGVGCFMFAIVAVEHIRQYQERKQEAAERARWAELQRYVVDCTHAALRLGNPGAEPRRIHVGKPVVIERTGLLTAPDERWNATWLDPADILLAPGHDVTLRYQTTPGVWGAELTFDLDLGNLRGRVGCRIK
jgi:hypothetical protein